MKSNNLQLIEGIGPKTEKLLRKSGVTTWAQLANSSVEDIQKILDTGGTKFQLQNPDTWPQQASLAVTGNWDGLIDAQKVQELGGEKDDNSKLENLLKKLGKR